MPSLAFSRRGVLCWHSLSFSFFLFCFHSLYFFSFFQYIFFGICSLNDHFGWLQSNIALPLQCRIIAASQFQNTLCLWRKDKVVENKESAARCKVKMCTVLSSLSTAHLQVRIKHDKYQRFLVWNLISIVFLQSVAQFE